MRMLAFIALLFAAMTQEPPPQTPPAPQQPAPPVTDTAPPPPPAPVVDPNAEEYAKAVFFGRKFFDLKEYGSAYEQFAKADALKPDQPPVLYDMALVLAKAGRFGEAHVKADRYNQLYPTGAEKPLVSKLLLELEFQRELQKKRQADQDYAELFNRGKFLYGRNDLDAALKVFQEAEQQRPNDPAAVFNQAVIYEKQQEFAKAAERFRRYAELEPEPEQKASIDQRVFALDNEIEDMKTKIVCSFCGLRLAPGAMWCHRCWHGPYTTNAAVWNTRPCVEGASATRSTYYSDNRLAKNDALPCMFANGTMRESLRYTLARQRAIQFARKAEGWTYDGDIIQGWSNQVRYVQGPDRLEKIVSAANGDILQFDAHKSADGVWLLDREDTIIDGQKYTSRYTFDDKNRIVQQQVSYQNAAACNHLINMTADYVYQNDALTAVNIKGGYEGFPAEGSPQTAWQTAVAYTYDGAARIVKEDLAVTSFTKTYMQKPQGALRDETSKIYISMRPRKPLENVIRMGDLCGTSGSLLLSNAIDLRPFYAMSPDLAISLPAGVARATVTVTYPDSYKLR
ncbi:MAG TPA: tetratricopeptide repeat protein [Thermoanaerobaculia bacterium]